MSVSDRGLDSWRHHRMKPIHFISCFLTDSVVPLLSRSGSGSSVSGRTTASWGNIPHPVPPRPPSCALILSDWHLAHQAPWSLLHLVCVPCSHCSMSWLLHLNYSQTGAGSLSLVRTPTWQLPFGWGGGEQWWKATGFFSWASLFTQSHDLTSAM